MAGRALIRRASDHREVAGQSQPAPLRVTRSPRKGPNTGSATTSKSGFHMLHSPVTIEDDENDPSPSEGIHTFGPAMWRARRLQKSTRNGLCREKGATDKNEPASDTLAVERSQGLGENNTQPETRERPLQRRFDLACLRFSVRVGCRRSSGRRELAFGLGCRRLCLVCVPVLCARCQQPRCHPARGP